MGESFRFIGLAWTIIYVQNPALVPPVITNWPVLIPLPLIQLISMQLPPQTPLRMYHDALRLETTFAGRRCSVRACSAAHWCTLLAAGPLITPMGKPQYPATMLNVEIVRFLVANGADMLSRQPLQTIVKRNERIQQRFNTPGIECCRRHLRNGAPLLCLRSDDCSKYWKIYPAVIS
jgi:hypothetical protein